MRTLILLSMSLFLTLEPSKALAGSNFKSAVRSMFKGGTNPRTSTEANYPHCTTGNCHGNPFRNGPIRSIPQDNIASGVPRVLASIYGACDAARPLNSINVDAVARNRVYNTYRATSDAGQAAGADWRVHVPNFNLSDRDVREVTNAAEFNRAGPYAAANRGRQCSSNPGFNVSSTPKSFGMGASGVMDSNGHYNILRCGQTSFVNSLSPAQKARTCGLAPGSQPAITIDCAEFIGAASVASCKKLHKSQKLTSNGFEFPVAGNRRELSTASMVDSARRGGSNACLSNSPQISASSSIQPGDIFAGSSAHSVMITKVGPDPLGINKARNRSGGCDSISYNDLDFDMAHSPSHAALGPINSTARAYASMIDRADIRNPYPLNKIVQMAIVMCKRQTAGSAQSFMNDPKFSLLRHKSWDEECSYTGKPGDQCPKVAGDECADECGV